MKFYQAINKLKEGAMIRRTCWEEGHYWKLGEYDMSNSTIINSVGDIPNVNRIQLNADDWEIYFPPRLEELTYEGYEGLNIKKIEPNHTIVIHSPSGKELILDFNGTRLKTSGDLKPDKAAKLFFDSLDWFFREAIENSKKEPKKSLSDKKLKAFKMIGTYNHEVNYKEEDVKEAVRKLKEEFTDEFADVLDLIDLEKCRKFGFNDFCEKLQRLLTEHHKEQLKVFGDKI